MDLQQAIDELLKFGTAANIITAAATMNRPVPLKGEVNAKLESLQNNIRRNRHNESVATIVALMLWDADRAVSRVRREGVLRASRYKYRSACVNKVVQAALKLAPNLHLSSQSLKYLQSVHALLAVAPDARNMREGLITRMRARQSCLLKTLLVVVNEVFSHNWLGNRELSSDTIEHWTAEEIAEGYSLLVDLFREEIGIKPKMWQLTDEQIVNPHECVYASLLLNAAKLATFREAETQIDGLPYEASIKGQVVTIAATQRELEKSIRLGYIQADLQVLIRAMHIAKAQKESDWQAQSIEDFVTQEFEGGLGKFVNLVEKPISRLVFGLPASPHLLARLKSDEPFLEELAMLYGAGIENFQPEAGWALRVSETLTALDVAKVQRLFLIINLVFHYKLKSIEDEKWRTTLTARSAIPVIRRDDLVLMLELVLSKDKAQDMLRFLTLSESEKFVDLQYRPFIQAGNWYVIAPAVVGKSNLVRNIVTANRLRTSKSIGADPMQKAVADALKEAGFTVRVGFNFDIDGKRETDIFCWRDDVLFVFECKNAYHPCSAHELRTSFEHLKTAEEQLGIRLDWLKRLGQQEKLFSALGWEVAPTPRIHTGIITANRAFTGYRMGLHPVRQAYEFINVLLRGHINISYEQPPIRFWRGETFQVADLVEYLEGETIVRVQMEALRPSTRRVRMGSAELAFDSFTMDMRDTLGALNKTFNVSEVTERGSG